jgi:hypothetical protein
LTKPLLLILSLIWAAPAFIDESCYELFTASSFERALETCISEANQCDAGAQSNLDIMYKNVLTQNKNNY